MSLRVTLSDIFLTLPAPLYGYYWESDDTLCVPFIASSGHPKAFLHFLTAIEVKGKQVIFPTVINFRLARLLKNRGYQYYPHIGKQHGWNVDGYVLAPKRQDAMEEQVKHD